MRAFAPAPPARPRSAPRRRWCLVRPADRGGRPWSGRRRRRSDARSRPATNRDERRSRDSRFHSQALRSSHREPPRTRPIRSWLLVPLHQELLSRTTVHRWQRLPKPRRSHPRARVWLLQRPAPAEPSSAQAAASFMASGAAVSAAGASPAQSVRRALRRGRGWCANAAPISAQAAASSSPTAGCVLCSTASVGATSGVSAGNASGAASRPGVAFAGSSESV